VEENLLAILESLALPLDQMKSRLESLLSELNISHLAKQKASSLSGGERRRLEITRALITEPRFMLLDEPFAGIDPLAGYSHNRQQLRDRGMESHFDHNVRETLKVCDSLYIISQGRIVSSATLKNPSEQNRAKLLSGRRVLHVISELMALKTLNDGLQLKQSPHPRTAADHDPSAAASDQTAPALQAGAPQTVH
jgi:ABC-type lipopolysaccharide export system ATPase subunit